MTSPISAYILKNYLMSLKQTHCKTVITPTFYHVENLPTLSNIEQGVIECIRPTCPIQVHLQGGRIRQ